jgi:hypothetical protein
MRRRMQAWFNLAYRFNRHMLVALPARALRGGDGARFRAATAAEGLLPLLPAERAIMPDLMRCVHCGLCALARLDANPSPHATAPHLSSVAPPAPPAPPAPYSAWEEPWSFIAGDARALDRAPLAARSAAALARAHSADALCPTGVPITAAARLMLRMAAATDPKSRND